MRDSAVIQLNNAMGIEGKAAYALDEPPPSAVMPDETLVQELQHAYARRPEMQGLTQQLQAAQENVRLAKAGRKPFVRSLATTGLINVGGDFDENHWFAAGVAMSWPFYTGGEVEAEVAASTHQMQELQAQQDELTQTIRLQVAQARLTLAELLESQAPVAAKVAAAEDGLRFAARRYQVGLGTLLEVQQAQLAVVSGRSAPGAAALRPGHRGGGAAIRHRRSALQGETMKRLWPGLLLSLLAGCQAAPVVPAASYHQSGRGQDGSRGVRQGLPRGGTAG